ncbi:MAG: YibE/F family protein [Candidatus Dojkabacteria bacterium]|jgi:uncharacterized membrane protein
MKNLFSKIIISTLLLLTFTSFISATEYSSETKYLKGRVVEILEEKDLQFEEQTQKYQRLKIQLLDTKDVIEVENGSFPSTQVIQYRVGDTLEITEDIDVEGSTIYYILGYVRTTPLLLLTILFVILAIIVGRKKSFFAIISMIFSFFVILKFILPKIQNGDNPVFVAIVGCLLIIPTTFYLSHSFERKTTIAILGTLISLVLTGILSYIFVKYAHLTGGETEDAMILQSMTGSKYNLQGILLAGIIIGTLGVMDDITVSQTAIVFQLKDLKKEIGMKELFNRSLEIGRDHIASMINTLVLVYAGASLPLLLIFLNNPRPFGDIVNIEMIATEIVRTLVGSIGLILAVPITTYLAVLFVTKNFLKISK